MTTLVRAFAQTAVEDLLKTFENATHNNNPITDTAAAAGDVNDANGGTAGDPAAAGANVINDDLLVDGEACCLLPRPPQPAVNQTRNNDAGGPAHYDNDNECDQRGRYVRQAGGGPAVPRRVCSNQNQSAGSAGRAAVPRMAVVGPPVRTTESHPAAVAHQRGRSASSWLVADRPPSAVRNASAVSLPHSRGRGPDLPQQQQQQQHPCRRASSSFHRHQQQQQQMGRDGLPRHTSNQPRRSSTSVTV